VEECGGGWMCGLGHAVSLSLSSVCVCVCVCVRMCVVCVRVCGRVCVCVCVVEDGARCHRTCECGSVEGCGCVDWAIVPCRCISLSLSYLCVCVCVCAWLRMALVAIVPASVGVWSVEGCGCVAPGAWCMAAHTHTSGAEKW
jgi:hypothetical protein